jgi:hypothetical protein
MAANRTGISVVQIGDARMLLRMQIPPKSHTAAQEPLKGSAEADLSDEQDDSPQQEQGTGRKSLDGSHSLGSSQGDGH